MQETMHDIFDVEFADEIEEAVAAKVWSELPQELVQKMVESAVNHIEMAELDPPPRKAIIKRLRDFYTSRRSLALVKDNPDKRRSRRTALKCSSTLYVSWIYHANSWELLFISMYDTILLIEETPGSS